MRVILAFSAAVCVVYLAIHLSRFVCRVFDDLDRVGD